MAAEAALKHCPAGAGLGSGRRVRVPQKTPAAGTGCSTERARGVLDPTPTKLLYRATPT